MSTGAKLIGGLILVALLFAGIFGLWGLNTIQPGYVAVVVSKTGPQRGVQDIPAKTGWFWSNPITTAVYEYPTFTQSVAWVRDEKEGEKHDQSITFNSREGASFNQDIPLNYSFNPEKVPHVFVEYRRTPEDLAATVLRQRVRDAFSLVASNYSAPDIMGVSKAEFQGKVLAMLREEFGPKGINIENVSMTGRPRLDPGVEQSINNVIQASQNAQAAQNKVAQVEAEARQKIAEAEGDKQAAITRAQGEAEANDTITKSLNPTLLEYKRIDRWDGKMPQVTGGATPMINLNK